MYNRLEADAAREHSQILLEKARETVLEQPVEETISPETPDPEPPREMVTKELDGYDCFGILSIPALELELPVLADWDYEKLQKAPCHYFGSCYESDFVIAAHNYPAHFGRLSELQPGDSVVFADMAGFVHCYEVALLETLSPTATMEMITSGFDLSLYTCTSGGGSRVTVRCNKTQ